MLLNTLQSFYQLFQIAHGLEDNDPNRRRNYNNASLGVKIKYRRMTATMRKQGL